MASDQPPKPKPQPAPPQPAPATAAGAPRQLGGQPSAGPRPFGAGANPMRPAGQPGAPGRVTLSKGHAKVGVNFKAQQRREEEEKKAREEEEAKLPIEDRVLAIPGMNAGNKEPEIFSQFLDKVAPKLILADTSSFILEAFSNIDVTAEKVSQVLKANPYFEALFLRVLEAVSKREEMPSIEGAIVLLGMQNFRNLILAAQMQRVVQGSHPEWDKDGKLKLSPSDAVKYALKTEELLSTKHSEYADTAYAAGLLYDFLAAIANAVCEDKKKVLAFIDVSFTHGIRTAQIAIELSKHVSDMGFQKYVFPAALLHDIGKVAMAIVRPGYINFLEDAKKKEWPRPIRQYIEQEKWEVDHSVVGGLSCHYFKMFRPIEKVIQYHHEPYLLKSRNRNMFQLASLVCLSTNIANNFKKTDKLDDPIVSLWRGPELQDFRIDMRGVLESIAKNVNI